ncbi:uncharacterized protein A4U43_C02F20020 [Asparagus officinalis]|uniref:Uncharacterized protein n=1 Tax=Asparagus officinalis TaxID=4686 RepID=A0A5P1FPD3_ASPOF|nr:uncharacterized protein A4U43_C02F20020 [Asparagus officinalis]
MEAERNPLLRGFWSSSKREEQSAASKRKEECRVRPNRSYPNGSLATEEKEWGVARVLLPWAAAQGKKVAGPLRPSSYFSAGWPALYASVLYGGVFGLPSMGAALSVAVPATVVTWITILMLLAFVWKPRRTLVMEAPVNLWAIRY